MEQPRAAGTAPMPVEVKAGESVWWCACGRSASQPFCDGSHAGTGIEPVEYVATRDRTLYFCTGKRTHKAPLCDGSHDRPRDAQV